MCGIAGFFSFNQDADMAIVERMSTALAHRGPDGDGHWIDLERNIALGHRRLAIIDLSQDGEQPMHYNDQYTITYNGEIYNFVELRKELIDKGYRFKTKTDTEVLLAAYDHWGHRCVGHFDGMFSFAIWDRVKKELYCARDRFGEKPFYYHLDDKGFTFASEMKALWCADITKKFRDESVYQYLLFGTTEDIHHPSKTTYQNIYKLQPASYALIRRDGSITSEKYWQIDLRLNHDLLSSKKAEQRFTELLTESVELRLRSDVAVGSSLSGGLDSSSIVTLVDSIKNSHQSQKTFSARFPGFAKDEGYFIRKAIENISADTSEVVPTIDSMIANWEKVLYHQDEPFGSFSISSQYEVMQLASNNNTKVLLDGQGADEYLAGYDSFYHTYYNALRKTNPALFHQEALAFEQMKGFPFADANFKTSFKQRNPNLFKKIRDKRRNMASVSSAYFVGIHPNIVQSYRKNRPPIEQFTNLKKHLHYQTFSKGLTDLLRYADRNAMAHSVEVRLPFLSHKLVAFVFALPDSMLIQDAWTKFILRTSMDGKMSKEIVWRKDKIGFEPPQNEWINHSFFKKEIKNAQEKLLSLGVITKTHESLQWKYLMLAHYID